MIRKLLKGAKGYEKQSVLTVLLVLLETALEVVLPLLMSTILNTMQLYSQGELLKDKLIYLDWSAFKIVTLNVGSSIASDVLTNTVITYGVLMIISAVLSLTFGTFAGRLAATAGAGFSKNMRANLFAKIQDFSFVKRGQVFYRQSCYTFHYGREQCAAIIYDDYPHGYPRACNVDIFRDNGDYQFSQSCLDILGCRAAIGSGYGLPCHKSSSAVQADA